MTEREEAAAAEAADTSDQVRGSGHVYADGAEHPEPAGSSAEGTKDEQSFGRWLLETVALIAVAFLLAQGIKTWIVQPYIIPTGSMLPTIQLNDRVLAEKISYYFRPVADSDIVVFTDPTGQHPQLIKRVIATSGQTVEVKEHAVYVNGKKLVEPYTHGLPSDPGTVRTPVTIPPGYIWVMGDNRTNSEDSRYLGPQPVSAVKGRAFWIYWPLNRFGSLN